MNCTVKYEQSTSLVFAGLCSRESIIRYWTIGELWYTCKVKMRSEVQRSVAPLLKVSWG
jgi:hypothetical protein